MKTKTKKLTYLTIGLMGALATSTLVGTILSSCTISASGNISGDGITLPDTWYSKDINWDDATSRNNLLIDDQGIVYSNKYMTEIIAIAPGYGGSTITIPASVKTISGYNNVTTTTEGTTKTPTGAFQNLTSLTNVIFAGKNITQIGSKAFMNCVNLQTINLPSSLNLIADEAFANCSSLSSINLNNVQYIGNSAFSSAFTNVPYGSIDLNLIQASFIGNSAFSGAIGIRNFDLSKNVSLTSIGNFAFANCIYWTGIVDISSDNYLSNIGESAFSGCTGITNIYLSNITPLKTIGASAFSGCTKLASIGTSGVTSGFIIPSTVTSIGTTAFANTLISSIDMSQTTATNPLKTSTFKDMLELTSINLGTKITTLPALLFQNTPKLSEFDLVVPASVTSIATANGTNVGASNFTQSSYSTFEHSGFKSIDLSNVSITSNEIGYCFFQGCSNLQTVKLKSNITKIKFRAFYNCTSLKNVLFINPSDNSSSSETGFVALSTLTEIGSYAFYNSGLESIDLFAVTSNIMGENDNQNGSNANFYRFANCSSLTTVKLPVTTTMIQSYNFDNNSKLESFNFSDLTNLRTINGNNFNGSNFSSIDFSNNTNLSYNTFANSNMFKNLLQNAEVLLPNSVTEIKDGNFTYVKSNDNGSGTTITNLNFQYPNGLGTSSSPYTNKILTSSGTNFLFLSRVSNELDFSNFVGLDGIGRNTFFGNTSLTSLKFAAKTFANGTFNDTQNGDNKYNYLGFIGYNITSANNNINQNPSTYVTANLPFGSMSGLSKITFKNFTNLEDDTTNENVMYKTNESTWKEVARIISSFAKSNSNSENSVANLSNWDNNNIVNATFNDSTKSATLNYTSGDSTSSINIDKDSNDVKFTYEGVEWTINVDDTNGTITISGNGIDTYRSVVGSNNVYSNSYKVFFNTKSETSDGVTTILPDSDITVTLNIVTNSSSTPE